MRQSAPDGFSEIWLTRTFSRFLVDEVQCMQDLVRVCATIMGTS